MSKRPRSGRRVSPPTPRPRDVVSQLRPVVSSPAELRYLNVYDEATGTWVPLFDELHGKAISGDMAAAVDVLRSKMRPFRRCWRVSVAPSLENLSKLENRTLGEAAFASILK
jgi:hypothetical protein